MLALILAVTTCANGAETVKLEPNAILRFDFPDLPDTLATTSTSNKQPARLTAQLPENYSRDGKFPVCIYLDGGDGGLGNKPGIARAIVGSRDFICVNLPLFKRTNGEGLVAVDDFEAISRAYRPMLQKLFAAVPNITPERSALGGFSNGAHATAVLVAGQDEFILSHFQSFYFADGGFGPLAANFLSKPGMKRYRFLLLRGDQADDDQPRSKLEREHNTLLAHALELEATEHGLDFTSIIMGGYGHAFPPKYMAVTGQWIRGEKLENREQNN